MQCHFVDTLRGRRVIVVQILRHGVIDRLPRFTAILAAVCATHRNARVELVGIFGIDQDGMQQQATATSFLGCAGRVIVQPRDAGPRRACVVRAKQPRLARAGP